MPIKNKGNLKAQQSRQWMEDALIRLMERKAYQDIPVQEITDEAQLSRRTFYRNYNSKDEILIHVIRTICKEYGERLRIASVLSFPAIAEIFFETMQNHLVFLLLLNRHHLQELFLHEINLLLPSLFAELKGPLIDVFGYELIEYALTFSIGGFGRTLIKWLNDGAKKSPQEMAATVTDIIKLINYPNSVV